MKKNYALRSKSPHHLKEILLTLWLTMVFTMSGYCNVYSQNNISLNMKAATLKSVLSEMRNSYKTNILYDSEQAKSIMCGDVVFNNCSVEEVLDKLLKNTGLRYKIVEDAYIITKAPAPLVASQAKRTITGIVTDEDDLPLIGVAIVLKSDPQNGVSTDSKGRFSMTIPTTLATPVLLVTYVGMIKQEVPIDTKSDYKIRMKSDKVVIDQVVVTGYFERSKQSITGAEIVVTGEKLRQVGSLNFMQAISVFDPSIRTIPNNKYGSDPNRVPDISIRGENGFDLRSAADDSRTNPNSPLYVLDGIEVSPSRVYDLDMNRVEAFSILKDAAATSLYGSRGANGVILIQTIKPKEGQVRVNVNSNFVLSIPDLRDYNLMNAAEKLEYERLAGKWTDKTGDLNKQMVLDEQFNERYKEVQRGVDTYWLSKPLRTSLNQRYNAFLEGGDRSFKYGIDLRYDTDLGIMKGSGRQKYGINVNFNYNIGTNFIMSNDLTFNDVNGSNSPYGSFDIYAKQNPVERIYDPITGGLVPYFKFNETANPLIDVNLPNYSNNTYTEIQDNFSADWRINNVIRLTARISFTKKLTNNEEYVSPNSSRFANEPKSEKRGLYSSRNIRDVGVDGYFTASYNKVFENNFSLSMGLGSNFTTAKHVGEGYEVTGFLNDKMNMPQFAQQYKELSRPYGSFDNSRMIGFLSNVNVGYDNRYFIDGSFRTDGSSKFGRNSRFAPFWSLGASWNVNREHWWKGDGTLKIRGSIGSTGMVNFSSSQAITQYRYKSNSLYNGVYGAVLNGYGNPDLKWQSTLQYNVGIDYSFLRNKIQLNVDGYIKQTQNLLLPIDIATSTGFRSFTQNMGSMENKGIDLRLRMTLIRDTKRDINWSVTLAASTNRNKIIKLSNALEQMNAEARKDSVVRLPEIARTYIAGQSSSALWVVRSMGIDPATGNEIYITSNGEKTFDYNVYDRVVVGDVNPKYQGNIQSNFNFKGINLFVVFNYEYGAKTYNATLSSKVESSMPEFNADKRVLTSRWKKPGDVAMFRRINDTSKPFQSSRLVQDNNYITFQTLSLSYDVPREYLNGKFVERCKFIFSCNELFRFSTIKQERGTIYPFAQSFSMGINLTF